jgi:hypothetical protein
VYDSTSESTSLQMCMCKAIILRSRNPLDLKQRIGLCVAWDMLDVAREIVEDSRCLKPKHKTL